MNKLLEAALKYFEMGYSVIPVRPDKKPYLVTWAEYQKKRATESAIRKWWKTWPKANIAAVTGKVSGIDIIDTDSEAATDALNDLLSDSLVCPVSQTPRGGRHFHFKHKDGLSNATGFLDKTDFKTSGGYAIMPPSVGENGKSHAWLSGLSIFEQDPPAMPERVNENETPCSFY